METRTVIYHSQEWGFLADHGWYTHTVSEPISLDGQTYRIATMVRR